MYDCEKICPFNFEYQFYEQCYQLTDFSKYDFFENAINFVNHRDNIVGASDNIKPVFEKLNSNFTNILPEPDYLKVSPIIDKEQLVIDDELIEHMNKINYFYYLLYNYIKRLWIFL